MNTTELETTAKMMVAEGKGILAIDESTPTIKKRFDSINVESTEENRRAYRDLLITNPDGNKYISGMILYDETIRQSTSDGTPFAEKLANDGIMPGIKVDTGAKDFALHSNEKITEGLDGLRERLAEYKNLGAKFAKWRAVITIGKNIPTTACINANAHALARYAGLCQEAGIVPMVEPEVLMDADNTIDLCYDITEKTLSALFSTLKNQDVSIAHTILKTNMVISGKQCPTQANVQEVAEKTVQCLLKNVPPELAGIVFLSGGQSDEEATVNLDSINKAAKMTKAPWQLSFSYGRGLQAAPLKEWKGVESNAKAAQKSFYQRAEVTSAAREGTYSR